MRLVSTEVLKNSETFVSFSLVSFDAVGLSGSAVVEDGSGQVDVEAGRGLLGLPPSNDRLHLSSSAP